MPRWLLLLPVALLAVALGGWWVLALRLERGWAEWADARRAEGWRIAHAPPERGPPGPEVTLRLAGFSVVAPEGRLPGGFGYRAEAVVLRLSWRDLAQLSFLPGGAQGLTLAGQEWPLAAQRLGLLVGLRDGAARISGTALRLGEGLTLGALDATWHAGVADLSAERVFHPSWRLLGGTVDRVGASLVPAPGQLDIRAAELRWGRLTATLSGRLTPDERRMPAGRLALRLRGAEAGLEALSAAGLLPGPGLPAARALLRLSTRDPGDGGGPVVELPAELRGGSLSIARIPVARLPPMEWR